MAGVRDTSRAGRQERLKNHRHRSIGTFPTGAASIRLCRECPERGPAFNDGGRDRAARDSQDAAVEASERGVRLVLIRGRGPHCPERSFVHSEPVDFMDQPVEYGLGHGQRLHNTLELLKHEASCAIRCTPYAPPLPCGFDSDRLQSFRVGQSCQADPARDVKAAPEQTAQPGRFASDENWVRAGFQWQDETIGHDGEGSGQ